MNNSKYTKDHTMLSASAINDDRKEAEDSCERVFNYVEINIEKACNNFKRFPCKVIELPTRQYLAITSLKITWDKT
jgi:hypothetical protein